jgi:hypothetical protein
MGTGLIWLRFANTMKLEIQQEGTGICFKVFHTMADF